MTHEAVARLAAQHYNNPGERVVIRRVVYQVVQIETRTPLFQQVILTTGKKLYTATQGGPMGDFTRPAIIRGWAWAG